MKKTKNYLWGLALLLTILFLLVTGVYSLVESMKADLASGTVVGDLELCYKDRDYEGMLEILGEQDNRYDEVFRKYNRVGEIYQEYALFTSCWQSDRNRLKENYGDKSGEEWKLKTLKLDLQTAFLLLADIRGAELQGYPYGEQDAVEPFQTEVRTVLMSELNLGEEEVEDGIKKAGEKEPDYAETAAKALASFSEQAR